MDIREIKRRLVNLKLAVVGYKTGHEPDWLRLKQLAFVQAMVEESDERALAALAGEVRCHPKAAREARERLAPYTSRYAGDRAVRLIDAAMRGSSVQPIKPECVELFAQEARLGRMPQREAFADIASCEPEIKRITQRLEESYAAAATKDEHAERESSHAEFVMLRDAQREVDQIIGPLSQHANPLLRSDIPRNIVYSWLDTISGGPPHVDPDASYFSRFGTGRS